MFKGVTLWFFGGIVAFFGLTQDEKTKTRFAAAARLALPERGKLVAREHVSRDAILGDHSSADDSSRRPVSGNGKRNG